MALFPSDTSQSPWTNPDDGVVYDFIDGIWVPQSTGGDAGGTFDDVYVNVSGDQMTGLLELSDDPVQDMEAATKKYVDEQSASITQNLVTIEQEIEVISPSRERGTYEHIPGTGPIDGQFHVNNAQYASVTRLKVAKVDQDGVSHSYSQIEAGDQVEVLNLNNSDGFVATLDNAGTDNGSYMQYPITVQRAQGGPIDGESSFVKFFTIAESDLNISDLEDKFVRKDTVAGDEMAGPLKLPGDPTNKMHASTKQYTDTKLPLDFTVLPPI